MGCTNQDPEGAAVLWERLQTEDYRALPRPPGYATRQRSEAIHAKQIDLYANQAVLDALADPTPRAEWPLGSFIVKDGWDGERLKIVAVMEKREAGWYWAEFHGDGSIASSGHPAICVGCHRTGDDFVRSLRLAR